MARYTGPNNKQARRVSFSILENGKDIANWTTTNGAQGAIFAAERNNGPLLRNVVGRDSKHAFLTCVRR